MNIKSVKINRSYVKQALMSLGWICKHVSVSFFILYYCCLLKEPSLVLLRIL